MTAKIQPSQQDEDVRIPLFSEEMRAVLRAARAEAFARGSLLLEIDDLSRALLVDLEPYSEGKINISDARLILELLDYDPPTLLVRFTPLMSGVPADPAGPVSTSKAFVEVLDAALALVLAPDPSIEGEVSSLAVLLALMEWAEAGRKEAGWLAGQVLGAGTSAREIRAAAQEIGPIAAAMKAGAALPEWIDLEHDDLVGKAERGEIDPVIGREAEIDRVIRILTRRTKNSPLLLGFSGVGKTAIVEGLALRIAAGGGGPVAGCRIINFPTARLVAGTRHRGDFEERVADLLAALTDPVNGRRIILFIDEIHTIVGAGNGADDSSGDLANLLKPALSRGALRIIGATTGGEFRAFIESDPALERRFEPFEVREPDAATTLRILRGLAPRYGEHHGVHYTAGALAACVELSAAHAPARRNPDRAIDLLDESGAAARIAERAVVDARWVNVLVTARSGLGSVSDPAQSRARMGERVVDREAAVHDLVELVSERRAAPPRRKGALAAALLVGPDGSGKGTLARAVADVLFAGRLIEIDGAAYAESHAISGLVGSPPGYIGYEQPAALIEPFRREPASVLFVRRADLLSTPALALLLDAIRDGEMHDTSGRVASFRHSLIVASIDDESARGGLGFGAQPGAIGAPKVGTPGALLARAVDLVISCPDPDENSISEIVRRVLRDSAVELGADPARLRITPRLVEFAIRAEHPKRPPEARRAAERTARPLGPAIRRAARRRGTIVLDATENGPTVETAPRTISTSGS